MNTLNDRTTSRPTGTVRSALIATAVAGGALLAFQAAAFVPQGGSSGSRSGMVSQSGPYTMMSSDAGNEDIVIVLDNRNEQLMVYKVDNGQSVQLFQKLALPRLFMDAKARAAGK